MDNKKKIEMNDIELLDENTKELKPISNPELIIETEPISDEELTAEIEPISEEELTAEIEPISDEELITETELVDESELTTKLEPEYTQELTEEHNEQQITNNNMDYSNNNKSKPKVYLDYDVRLILYCAIFLLFFCLSAYFIPKAFNLNPTRVNYEEHSDLDYKVYLKENNFYDTDYLEKDKIYVASLIDNILIDFNYQFNIEKSINMDFHYDVIAKLSINDEVTGKNYYEKDYIISSNNRSSISDSTNYNLNEEIKIDYDYYNSLANEFKQLYGVSTTSNLTVYLKVGKESDVEETSKPVDISTMYVKIPLSEKAINIELNYQDINQTNYMTENDEFIIDNILYAVASIACLAAAIIVAIKLIRFISLSGGRKNAYDKFVGKILNEYDRLIVENTTGPDLKNNNIIKIEKFEELLDLRDNLKLPIMYYVVSKHNKCYFYIKQDKDLYLMTIKAVDLEENNKK